MTMTIFKYPLALSPLQEVKLPKDAEILSVQDQRGTICLWAAFPGDDEPRVSREIEIVGTGQPVESFERVDRKFLGTVQQGDFVWHVFERV